MVESELTEFVRKDLESIGYTTYAEVCFKGGGNIRCDMYARCENESNERGTTMLFEAKLTFNLKVIEQAYQWKLKNAANSTYVIVPTTYKNMNTRKFAREVCRLLGIGVMEVNIKAGLYKITVKPTWCSNPTVPTLYEEQKLTIASNSDNNFVTPFKITVKRLNEYMENKTHDNLTNVIKNIKHHYKGDIRALRNIRNLIDTKVIEGFYISKENGKIVIHKNE